MAIATREADLREGGTGSVGLTEVKVPDIGDFKDVPIIEVHVRKGDAVNADDPLITLESDKASMEVPAPIAGTVQELYVTVGDRVSEGRPILALEAGDGALAQPPSLVGQQEPPKRAAAGLIARLSLALACYVRLRTTRANQLCQQVDGVVDRDDVGDHQRRSAVNVDRVEIGPFIGEKLHHFADFRLR